MIPQPPPAVLELDGYAIRRLGSADAGWALRLRDRADNSLLLELPEDETACARYLEDLRRGLYSLPIACLCDGEPIGLALTGLGNARDLNVFAAAVFEEPASAAIPLALYVRHLFWTFPLHRLYTQLPLAPGTRVYELLLTEVGFKPEGVLSDHLIVGENALDVTCLGLLRSEFDAWAPAHQPRLAL